MSSKDKSAKEDRLKNETSEQLVKRKEAIKLIERWMKELEKKDLGLLEGGSEKIDK